MEEDNLSDEEKLKVKQEELDKQNASSGSNVIDAARVENDRREEILKNENELQDRKEKLHAEEIASGRSVGGGENQEKIYTEEEKKSRARIKAVGEASGSTWAKNY